MAVTLIEAVTTAVRENCRFRVAIAQCERSLTKGSIQQECTPVGCVSSAAVESRVFDQEGVCPSARWDTPPCGQNS